MTTPKKLWLSSFTSPDIEILDDVLQEQEHPVEFLKSLAKPKAAIIVPNEWSWPAELKPFTNPKHKQHYDTDLLAQDLEAAGYVYIIRLLEFSNWSFLTAEAARHS